MKLKRDVSKGVCYSGLSNNYKCNGTSDRLLKFLASGAGNNKSPTYINDAMGFAVFTNTVDHVYLDLVDRLDAYNEPKY